MSKLKKIALAVLTGVLLVWALSGYAGNSAALQPRPSTHRLTDGIEVSPQIAPEHMAALKNQGIRTVIDLRPDGEALGQPSSRTMAQAAKQAGLEFGYVPVPHGDVPLSAVDALGKWLAHAPRPVLLYCRSGSRAVRAWALMEASRPGGLDAAGIAQRARDAGRPVDDLRDQIAQRIAARGAPSS
ncbi:MAG: TIGR01244 family phosphatase [Burkholderiaceae bacterium]|jgi:uncharacterized protein (TIGR01244 family)|nr:TIGR01244 family phosphatase [Burkholderiaceae bacterium]